MKLKRVRWVACPYCNSEMVADRGELQVCFNRECCAVFSKAAARTWLVDPL